MVSITSSDIGTLVVVGGNLTLPFTDMHTVPTDLLQRSESLDVEPPSPPPAAGTTSKSPEDNVDRSADQSPDHSADERLRYRWFISLLHYDKTLDAYVRYGGILSPAAYNRLEDAQCEGSLYPAPCCCLTEVFTFGFLPENDPIHRRTYVKKSSVSDSNIHK